MCEATTILAIATTLYGVNETRQNAKRQERAYREAQKVEEKQILDNKSVEANERARRGREERARVRAMSAETGALGISLDEILNDIDFQTGMDMANIATNTGNSTRASRAGLGSRLAGIEQPDYVAAGLQIGTTSAQYYKDNGNRWGSGG